MNECILSNKELENATKLKNAVANLFGGNQAVAFA